MCGIRPWQILGQDAQPFKHREELHIQLYEDGGRQHIHLDNGMVWMRDGKGNRWAPTAIVLHLNDGYGTYLAGPALSDVFGALQRRAREGHVQGVVKTLVSTFSYLETQFKQPPLRRAGHMLCFH